MCTYAADPPPQPRSTQVEDPTVNARLRRLEEAVEALRSSALPPLTPVSADSPAAALDWLEDAGIKSTNQHIQTSHHNSGGPSFTVVRISGSTEVPPSSPSFLPTLSETLRLFTHYNDEVGYLHYIVYTPTTTTMIHDIYAALPSRMHLPSTALLLVILAASAHFWDPTVGIFNSASNARHVSRIWLSEALKTLDQSRASTAPALEDVQATIIASYLAYNMQGYSAQFRLLQTTALELARQAQLHKTDAPGLPSSSQQQQRDDPLRDEMKRRVWWHIVATDWLLSFTSGPQEGTYLIQPRHMTVRQPLNSTDADPLTALDPASHATAMSFFTYRTRFAIVCRTVADALPSLPFDLRRADATTIKRLDGMFEAFFGGLPGYFQMREGEGGKGGWNEWEREEVEKELLPRLGTQRLLLHLCVHMRRCKLHQPWLVPRAGEKQEKDRAFSRGICLESARKVVAAAQMFEEDEECRRAERGGGGCGEGRLSTVVHHVAMAAVVLVVDLCFSGLAEGTGERERRKAEIREACRVLERARRESEMAARFLKSLGEMLKRHEVDLRITSEGQADLLEVRSPDITVGGNDDDFEALLQSCADMGGAMDISGWEDLFASFSSFPQFIDLAV
ncbi:putative transcription factor lepB [Lasiodiplodia hormozganensis]|uniref:Transcription factor lepB n=1 Tax=Lasiodiplodia hormozganensis TaxID=869390 RepID=A0AA39WV96_9PEZI|nr:putative transcription factor lepB [Lasiodiplodia hormozganensis]